MVPIARRNLFAEKGRFLISVGGVTFAVLLILVVLGLYRGFEREAGSFVESVPADLWVMERDTTDVFHSFSIVPEEKLDKVRAVPGVARLVPVYGKRITVEFPGGGADTFLMAFDVPPGTDVLRGIGAPGPGQIIVDSVFARKTGLVAGDVVKARDQDLTVTQISDISNVGLSQFSLVSAADARAIIAVPGIASYAMVSVKPGADATAVARAIGEQVPGVRAETRAAFAATNRNEIMEFFLPIITVLLVIAFLVGTAVIGLTIYTATIERTREFGVMKAVGASAGFLYRVVLVQSVIVGTAGFLLGFPLTLAVNWLAREMVPEFVNVVRWQDVLAVFAAALVMGLLAAFAPVRRINSIDPALVFRA